MATTIFKRNGGGGAGGIGDFLAGFGFDSFEFGFDRGFSEPLFPRTQRRFSIAPVSTAPPITAPEEEPTPPPATPTIPQQFSTEGVEPVGFFDNIVDIFQDAAVGVGRSAARLLVPDPIEAAIQVFFPDLGAQVFGSPLGLPAPQIIPPSFPVVISEAGAIPGATPPFLPGPPGTIGRTEDLFPGVFGPRVANDPVFNIPANINDPDFGVVQDAPGIFDDLGRAAVDIVPELIPELFGGGVGGAIAGGIADFFIDSAATAPGFDTEGSVLDGDFQPTGATPMAATISVQEWEAKGRPSGFCLTHEGRLTRRRRRRRRPLSQQAKDDLAWAKATFGAGKQFDAVVSRMRF